MRDLGSAFGAVDRKGALAGSGTMAVLAGAIYLGSRGLRDYDLALLPYTLGALLASFASAYRYAVWMQRPATALYWRRGLSLAFRRRGRPRNLGFLARSVGDGLVLQRFIRPRGRSRWVAHLCLSWGCLLAAAVTFPLVFGWMHFETRHDDTHWYRLVALGHVMLEFQTRSLLRYVLFNLLNLSAVMVMTGVALSLARRWRNRGARARQQFVNDVVPLLLLLAIAGTGLMLTVSMHLLHGRGYAAVSLVHALVVTGTLLYLPFGKLFHLLQRPLQIGVAFYRRNGEAAPPAVCRACGEGFAGAMHVADLATVLAEVGLTWNVADPGGRFGEVCPRCRRRLLGSTQGRRMDRAEGPDAARLAASGPPVG
jgi:NNP family nitrate/nitrite transporter-like MFS transporter